MKGYEPKRINVKHCGFRISLLNFCRESFYKMFQLQDDCKLKDDEESRLKHKEKLFGNIDFIGELYRQYLLPERIIFQIFSSLLGLDTQEPNEDTLEAALNLVSKVGPELEVRVKGKKTEKTKDGDSNKPLLE
jgi:translation initiation factor 4G